MASNKVTAGVCGAPPSRNAVSQGEAVFAPQRRHVFGQAFQLRIGIGIDVVGDHVHVFGDPAAQLQFDAARARLARLDLVVGVVRVVGLPVLLPQIVGGGGELDVGILRHVLDAGLDLLAAHGLPALVVEVGTRDRGEGFAVAQGGRPAVGGGIQQAEAFGRACA
ncbi:hypothetical protein G6F57_019823 [Rhizopus arrhizus]|nr:hypothetical protein G6F57_019823 [Rhizopus arrhizus]